MVFSAALLFRLYYMSLLLSLLVPGSVLRLPSDTSRIELGTQPCTIELLDGRLFTSCEMHYAPILTCAKLEEYGGGWTFVNSGGRSCTNMTLANLESTPRGGYNTPTYDFQSVRFNQVLVRRLSSNWCDSWGRHTSNWVQTDGASMGIQADDDYFYYFNNGQSHALIRAETSYRT